MVLAFGWTYEANRATRNTFLFLNTPDMPDELVCCRRSSVMVGSPDIVNDLQILTFSAVCATNSRFDEKDLGVSGTSSQEGLGYHNFLRILEMRMRNVEVWEV